MRPREPWPCAWCGETTRGRKIRLAHRGRAVDLHLDGCYPRWEAVEGALGRLVLGEQEKREGRG